MATISADKRRGFLEDIYEEAVTAAVPLLDALKAYRKGLNKAVRNGTIVVSHSGSGQSMAREEPSVIRGFSQDEVYAFAQVLVEVCRDTAASLSLATDGSQDPALLTGMLNDDRMQSIRKVQDDYTLTRIASYGPWTTQ